MGISRNEVIGSVLVYVGGKYGMTMGPEFAYDQLEVAEQSR